MNGFWTNEMVTVAKGNQPTNQKFFDESKETVLMATDRWVSKMEQEMQDAQKLLEEYPEKIKTLQRAKDYAVKTDNLLPLAKLHGFLRNVEEDLGSLTDVPA